jgi:hypothetical protein
VSRRVRTTLMREVEGWCSGGGAADEGEVVALLRGLWRRVRWWRCSGGCGGGWGGGVAQSHPLAKPSWWGISMVTEIESFCEVRGLQGRLITRWDSCDQEENWKCFLG